jgi:glycosyltransferase involved in cell wall biosynthesis
VLEAMSIGVPVIATAHGGPVEMLGAAGLLVPPNDPGALAAAIERLLSDRALYDECAAAGPELVARHFVLERQIEAQLDVVLGAARREVRGA